MKVSNRILLVLIVFFAFGLILSTACAKKEGEEPTETLEMEEPKPVKQEVELPAAVLEAIEANVPDAEIDFVEVAEEEGITLYDIEFKADRGEIEVAEDGTVIDVVTIITMEDLPEAAAKAIQNAIEDATIKRLEKSEIRSEIKMEGEMGTIVRLDIPRYVYEAELEKDGQTGEITVDAEGNITEPLKWDENELTGGF
jgi:uncharacterized membrane protein YkoI